VRFLRGEKTKDLLPHSLAGLGPGFENDFAFFYQIKKTRFLSFPKNDPSGFELCRQRTVCQKSELSVGQSPWERMFAYAFCHRICCHFGQDSLSRFGLIVFSLQRKCLTAAVNRRGAEHQDLCMPRLCFAQIAKCSLFLAR
jgi:hypothetical protein